MKVFSLQTKRHWLGWSLVLGAALFCVDHFVPFADLGIARCGPGHYTFPIGHHKMADLCEPAGDMDALVSGSMVLTILFWISLPTIILGLARYSKLSRVKRSNPVPEGDND